MKMSEVAKLRRYKGLTQKDVSKILGVSLQSYYRKEKGKTPFTDNEKVMLKELFIEDFPEISIDTLFFNSKVSKVESQVKEEV